MGFVSPVEALLSGFGVEKDARGNAKATVDAVGGYATNAAKVFAAGDVRRGQSLVVWAIREGRQAARAVDEFLTGLQPAALTGCVGVMKQRAGFFSAHFFYAIACSCSGVASGLAGKQSFVLPLPARPADPVIPVRLQP